MDLRTGTQRGLETEGKDIKHEAFDIIFAGVIIFGNKIRTEILLKLLKGVIKKLIIVKEEVRDDI